MYFVLLLVYCMLATLVLCVCLHFHEPIYPQRASCGAFFYSAGMPSRNTFGPATSAQEVVGLLKNRTPGTPKMEEV